MVRDLKTVFGHYKYRAIGNLDPVDVDEDDDSTRKSDPIEEGTDGPILVQDFPVEVLVKIETSLVRKLNLRLLACTWVMFILNFLDRVCIYILVRDCDAERKLIGKAE